MSKEELKVIYDRAVEYILAKYNEIALTISIEADGSLSAEYLISKGCCGDQDEYGRKYFNIEDLSSDLDSLVEERKQKEREEAEKERIRREEQEAIHKQIEKEQRRIEYLKLKKEFEYGKETN